MSDYRTWRGSSRKRTGGGLTIPNIVVGTMLIGAFGASYTSEGLSFDGIMTLLPGSGCDIKGNISINTGERIYHVPGQRHYQETRISPQYGERWFCTEAEARRAGWRRSRV